MSLIDPVTEVWNHSRSKGTDRVVLLAIAKHADPDGYAWPGFNRLAKMANVGERATQVALAKLIGSGEVAVLRGRGRGHASLYRVLLGQPEGAGRHEVMLAWLRTKTTPYLADLYGKVNDPAPSVDPGKVQEPTPFAPEKVQDRALEKVQDPAGNATAYRNELPVVEGEELPPTAAGTIAERITSRDLLAEHIDALGYEPATKGRLASVVKRLLDTLHIPADTIRAALALMRERGLTSPSVLEGLVDDIQGGKTPKNGQRPARYSLNGDKVTPPTELLAWARRGDTADGHPALEASP